MKIAVFGRTGQVATELQRRCPEGVGLTVMGRDVADFSNPTEVGARAAEVEADAVINAVAYTAVDKAEEEEDLANTVNGHSVARLAEVCAARAVPLLHISTDYVFPGVGERAWQPDDPTAPLSAYGRSKLMGEQAIQEQDGNALILRTSWVFSAHGANFVKTMLHLGAERESLNIVADQIGGPTPAAAIADALYACASAMVNGQKGGTYHFSGAPDASWAEFAAEIFAQAGIDCAVSGIPTTAYPTPAKRPLNSRLDCESLSADFGVARPDWRAGLADVLKEIT